MKRQTGVERPRDHPAEQLVGDCEEKAASTLTQLTEEQKQVLDCLQHAGTGLTHKQIVARVACPAPAVEQALDGLLEKNLVARLNTLVPSYSSRYPGVRVYTE